jgi:NADH dehydrogenase/NADH:ubiquinone oxidoreductase subunit G
MPVNLTINGKPIQADEGMTVLEAARANGISIPTLCHHPDLSPVGACRMCVVEVEKMRGLVASCTLPVSEGMVVQTDTPKLIEERKFILEMLLSDHPNDCMTCKATGVCELQDLVYQYQVEWETAQGQTPQLSDWRRPEPLRVHRFQQVHYLYAMRARVRGNSGAQRVGSCLSRL